MEDEKGRRLTDTRKTPGPKKEEMAPFSAGSARRLRGGVPRIPASMPGPYRTLRVERLYASEHCVLRRDRVAFPGGGRGVHHVIEIPDAAVVVPVLDDGRVVLLRQYRYAPARYLWEVPAGRIGPGETAREAARRECEEEAGWRPRRLEGGDLYYPLAGISSHRAFTFVGRRLVRGRTDHERTEAIEVHAFAPRVVRRMIRIGEIREGFSIAALARFFLGEGTGPPTSAASRGARRVPKPGRRRAARRGARGSRRASSGGSSRPSSRP